MIARRTFERAEIVTFNIRWFKTNQSHFRSTLWARRMVDERPLAWGGSTVRHKKIVAERSKSVKSNSLTDEITHALGFTILTESSDVDYWHLADVGDVRRHVGFTPDSGHQNGHH